MANEGSFGVKKRMSDLMRSANRMMKHVVVLREYRDGRRVAVFPFDTHGKKCASFDGEKHGEVYLKHTIENTKDFYDDGFVETLDNHGYTDIVIMKPGKGYMPYTDDGGNEKMVWFTDVLDFGGKWAETYEEDGVKYHQMNK